MSKIKLTGESSGYVEISAGASAGNNTLDLPSGKVKLVGADSSDNIVVGVATGSNFKTGSSNLHSTGLSVGDTLLHTTGLNVGTGVTIHSPASNILTLGTNDAERLRITSSGEVGINSTSPSTPLELYTDISSAWKFRINTSVSDGAGFYQRSNGDFEMVLRDASNNNNYIAGTSGALQFAASGSEKVRITSSGNVGIGTDNPGDKLTVYNPNNGNPTGITIRNTEASSTYSHARLRLESQNAAAYADIWADVANSSLRLGYNSSSTVNINSSGRITSPERIYVGETYNISNVSGSIGGSGGGQDYLGLRHGTTFGLILKTAGTNVGNVGIGTDNPGSKLTVYETGGNAKLQLQRANTANDTDDYGSILWRSVGGTAVGGINVARESAENDGYMFFQTASGGTMAERLRILADGTIRRGSPNGANGKEPIELFFQKRSTQIGKRIHQGSGSSATTHNILNIDSWQSGNSHAFIYVTVYYVSPVANYGGRMECYATAVNSGGNVSGGQGTFATSDAGRWGNPGVPSLSWSGSTLRFTTLAHAYMDYSLDITCIAYDGAVVSFYGN